MAERLRRFLVAVFGLVVLGYSYANLFVFVVHDQIFSRNGLVAAEANTGQTAIRLTTSGIIALFGTAFLLLWIRERLRRARSGEQVVQGRSLGSILGDGLSRKHGRDRD